MCDETVEYNYPIPTYRVTPIYSVEAEVRHVYLTGKESLKDREHAIKFMENVKRLNIPHMPAPSREDINEMSPRDADRIINAVWDRYFLTTSDTVNKKIYPL